MALPTLLRMPAEVRLLIYHILFRDTEVVIHDIPQESTHSLQADSSQHASYWCCIRKNQKQCINLLLANRLVSKEATEVFLRETRFTIDNCPCWNSGRLPHGDFLTTPRRALPNVHHVAVHAVLRTELGQWQYLQTLTSIWHRIAGKDGFPSQLKTLKIEGLFLVPILDHYIFARHSIAAKISITILPMVGWLPSDSREPLILVDIEELRVTISVPRHTDLVAFKKRLTQLSALQNIVVVLNVCGQGARDFG